MRGESVVFTADLPPVGVEKPSDQDLAQHVDHVEAIGLGQAGQVAGRTGRDAIGSSCEWTGGDWGGGDMALHGNPP